MSNYSTEGWQLNKSLAERNKYILKNSLDCDYEFLVTLEDGENEVRNISQV